MRQQWRVVDGEVRLSVEEAEWWGASLSILVAAIHHPGVLAKELPGTDPAQVAREVLAEVAELYWAATAANAQGSDVDRDRRRAASVRRDGQELVFTPGGEVANLAMCLELFATAVLEPDGPKATVARGATAYAASAWSADIGEASGALESPGHGRRRGCGEDRT